MEPEVDYFRPDEERTTTLKRAAIVAIAVHLLLFLIVVPEGRREPEVPDRMALTVVRPYTPPAPPSKARKARSRKKATRIPIPDPTPDEPEPIEIESSESELESEAFHQEFAVGEPVGVPGSRGAREDAVRPGDPGVSQPVIVRQVDPEYTPEATRRGVQGEVLIEAVIDVDGSVVEPRLIRGLPDEELNRRAMEAIQRWEFEPAMRDGEPVAMIALFRVAYRLH